LALAVACGSGDGATATPASGGAGGRTGAGLGGTAGSAGDPGSGTGSNTASGGQGGSGNGGFAGSGGVAPGSDAGSGGAAGGASSAGGASNGGTSNGGTSNGGTGNGGTGNGGTSSGGTSSGGTGGAAGGTSRKLDLLLVVDNSVSMADKQAVLRRTVPDLVKQLTDTAFGLEDLHVGVITSSLGGHGSSNTCAGTTAPWSEQQDDHGHLVGTRPRAATAGLPGGFATWARPTSTAALVTSVQNLVVAAGEFGCGLEATLESAYRFLADPNPPLTIQTRACTTSSATPLCAFPTGRDDELLTERAAFLRPDSAVAVVVLSDENDCSIRDTNQFYYAARQDITLPRGSSACAANPNDPCCYSCATAPPAGCTADPVCQTTALPAGDKDNMNIRCFEQKRRFGMDMLYPIQRYVNALRQPTLCTSRVDLDARAACPDADSSGAPDVVRNPLFPDPATASGPVRDPSMVYLLGVVGVPWQTIRATKDTSGGALPAGTLRYRTGAELAADGTWSRVLGDPAGSPPVPATDPLMVESVDPRTGTTPGTGEALASPSATYLANSVNGHEWGNIARDDLQFACIFPLGTPLDCTQLAKLNPAPGCDCTYSQPGDNTPLCQASTGTYGTTQYFAKGYPGLRHLALAKALGDNAAVASICARNITDDTQPDFGYRAAVDVLVSELRHSVR
jgi:hypothetical protein